MFEESSTRIPRTIIFFIGGILILVGLILVLLGVSSEAKVGGLVIIGPIPFFFYSEEPTSILSSLILFIFLVILMFIIFTYLALRRSSSVPE